MKKTRLLPIILTMITAVLLLAASAWGLYGSKTARADSYSDSNAYTFYFENYDVELILSDTGTINISSYNRGSHPRFKRIFHGFTSQRIHPENSVFQKGTL